MSKWKPFSRSTSAAPKANTLSQWIQLIGITKVQRCKYAYFQGFSSLPLASPKTRSPNRPQKLRERWGAEERISSARGTWTKTTKSPSTRESLRKSIKLRVTHINLHKPVVLFHRKLCFQLTKLGLNCTKQLPGPQTLAGNWWEMAGCYMHIQYKVEPWKTLACCVHLLSLKPLGWWTLWRTVSVSLAVCSRTCTTFLMS